MSVRLRIVSGAHKGAELELTPGDWSVGSDALCDVLISDVAPREAVLRVGEDDSVWLFSGDDATEDAGQELPHFRLLTWGQVTAAVGPTDGAWPPLEAAEPQPVEQSADSAPLRMGDVSADENVDTALAGTGSVASHGGGFEATGGVFSRHAGRTFGSTSLARMAVVLFLLALTVGGVWKFLPDSPEKRRENIESVLRAEGLKPSAFEVDEKMGAWTVRGVVTDDVKLQDVSKALRGLGLVLHLDITSRQAVAAALEARVAAEGARLKITLRNDVLRLSGYVYDAKALEVFLQPLKEQCERVALRQDVVFWQELRRPLQESLSVLKLEGRVRLTPGPYTIALDTTALGSAQQEALRGLEREVTDMTRGISPLVRPVGATAQVTTTRQPQVKVAGAVLCDQLRVKAAVGVAGGALLVTFEGRDYAPGAHLPNGMQVQEVRPEYVTLILGERLVYCPTR